MSPSKYVFMQFAGFTFGKSASAYATPWHGYPGNNTSFLLGGHDTVTGVNNIQYTAQFGNGVSATIGLDDPTVFNRTAVSTEPRLNSACRQSPDVPGTGTPTPMPACMRPTSSATSASTRPGVCSRFRPPRTKSTAPTTALACPVFRPASPAPNPFGPSEIVRSSRHQVGRFGDGCVADQEHPDRRRRRFQDRRHATPRVTPRT